MCFVPMEKEVGEEEAFVSGEGDKAIYGSVKKASLRLK